MILRVGVLVATMLSGSADEPLTVCAAVSLTESLEAATAYGVGRARP